MSIQELESEVTRLSKPDLAAFNQWFDELQNTEGVAHDLIPLGIGG